MPFVHCHLCEVKMSFPVSGKSAVHVTNCTNCESNISFVRIKKSVKFFIEPWVKVRIKDGHVVCPNCQETVNPMSKFFMYDLKCLKCASTLGFSPKKRKGKQSE